MPGKLSSIREMSHEFGVSDKTLRRKIKAGDIPAYRCGPRLIRLDREEVKAALMQPVAASTPTSDIAYDQLAEHAAKVVADWPKPTPEQLQKIAAVLRHAGGVA